MKKLYRFSAIALCVLPLFFTSCSDYLDRDDDDNITEADVFARYEKVNGLGKRESMILLLQLCCLTVSKNRNFLRSFYK